MAQEYFAPIPVVRIALELPVECIQHMAFGRKAVGQNAAEHIVAEHRAAGIAAAQTAVGQIVAAAAASIVLAAPRRPSLADMRSSPAAACAGSCWSSPTLSVGIEPSPGPCCRSLPVSALVEAVDNLKERCKPQVLAALLVVDL